MSEFKPGDKVRCVSSIYDLVEGREYEIEDVIPMGNVRVQDDPEKLWYRPSRFELVTEPARVAVADELPDTVMIQVDRKAELERIETVHGHMVDSMCSIIRRYADEYNLDFCDAGLESFCNEVGVEFTGARAVRRAVIFVDLKAGSLEEQEEWVSEMFDKEHDGHEWSMVFVDDEENRGEEWSSGNPRSDDMDYMHET